MAEKYEIKWRGETYYASDLTDEIKRKYCVWLVNHMLDNARKVKTAADYLIFDRKLMANLPEWTSGVATEDVLESFKTMAGQLHLMRLVLDIDADLMTDAELQEFVNQKEADEASDLNRAMKLIKEAADPKVQRGDHSSPRPTAANGPMPRSATSQSDYAETKSAT